MIVSGWVKRPRDDVVARGGLGCWRGIIHLHLIRPPGKEVFGDRNPAGFKDFFHAHPAPGRVALLADFNASRIQYQRGRAEMVVDQVLQAAKVEFGAAKSLNLLWLLILLKIVNHCLGIYL